MNKTKKIALISVIAMLVVALIVALAFASSYHGDDICTGYEIVLDQSDSKLLTELDVQRFISMRHLDPKGKICNTVDLAQIENELQTMPLIKSAECCFLKNGILEIVITRRHPLFRVRTSVSDYCIDSDGSQMVTPSNIPDSIIIVRGDVTIQSALNEIYPLVRYIYSQPSLASEFRTLSVGRGNQVSLRSNRCSYIVIIGKPDRYEQCFEKLQRFRQWDSNGQYQKLYKSIDLQYRGQIVCKRK